ncbi:MAG: hypothetical protein HY863_13740 [Chloroflexi bacterium]|nr:hypothetical protein [Chloroflexota bacterium]
MSTTNYYETIIEVSEDCPVEKAEVPQPKNGERMAAVIQYEMFINNPYRYTSDDVIFGVFAEKNKISKAGLKLEREKFFSKGQPCLRSSPLVKRYGWGVHFNKDGKAAIYAVESNEYRKFCKDKAIKHLKGMKSKR